MDDESIVPKKLLLTGKDREYAPVLRADATDDDLDEGTEPFEDDPEVPKFATGGTVSQGRLVCPICGLDACGHNLDYVPEILQ